MLNLEVEERNELLVGFQQVMKFLQDKVDEKILASLELLRENKLPAALREMDDSVQYDKVLTDLKSLLESEYKQCVRLQ